MYVYMIGLGATVVRVRKPPGLLGAPLIPCTSDLLGQNVTGGLDR